MSLPKKLHIIEGIEIKNSLAGEEDTFDDSEEFILAVDIEILVKKIKENIIQIKECFEDDAMATGLRLSDEILELLK